MNNKLLCGYFECRHGEEPRRTLADMQEEMKKLNADIRALANINVCEPIKIAAQADLMEQKARLLAEMHEELNRMYC